MNSGRVLGYFALAFLIIFGCLFSALAGFLAGGMVGGMAGFVAGRGGARAMQVWPQVLPQILPRLQVTPQVPVPQRTPQATPQVPRSQTTPQVPAPQRTPQSQRTPQATPQVPSLPIPAGQTGALVQTVEPGMAADKAGVKVGDVIAKVDDAPVDASHLLTDLIRAHKPGDKVTLTVLRRVQTLTLEVTLGTRKLETGEEVAALGITYLTISATTGPTY